MWKPLKTGKCVYPSAAGYSVSSIGKRVGKRGALADRDCLLAAAHKITVPVMLIHAANDYSVAPAKAMADELWNLSKPHIMRTYPRR